MEKLVKNRIFTLLVVMLFLANVATLIIFWFDRSRPLPQQSGAREFIIRELKFNEAQEQQFDLLVKEHRDKAQLMRESIKEAKNELFALLKQPRVTDSMKRTAARKVSLQLEDLDLSTLDHFQKVRAICDDIQREKFDRIINRIVGEMGRQGGMGPGQSPPGGPGGERIPPPEEKPDGRIPRDGDPEGPMVPAPEH